MSATKEIALVVFAVLGLMLLGIFGMGAIGFFAAKASCENAAEIMAVDHEFRLFGGCFIAAPGGMVPLKSLRHNGVVVYGGPEHE